MYTMAKTSEGCYVNSVPDAANFYKSTHWMDHMAYAAAWMYAATGEQIYLTEAQTYYARHVNEENGGKAGGPRSGPPLPDPWPQGPLHACCRPARRPPGPPPAQRRRLPPLPLPPRRRS
jgi:hypothetical protein